MLKKITQHLIFGLATGFVCTTACLWIFGGAEATGMAVMRQFTTWLAASALYGLFSLIYDTNLPLPVLLSTHFIGCGAITFIASMVSGILEAMPLHEWFIRVLPVFVVLYLIIGAAITLATHYQAKKINEKISKK